jgi:sugar phosphate isomerase/epimerase
MQLGIMAKTFSRATVEEVFGAVARHGLDCVQFNFACAGLPSLPNRIDPGVLQRIRLAARERGLVIAAVSGTFNMIHPDPEQRRSGLQRLNVVANASARLGAPVVTLCTGTRDPDNMWQPHPGNDAPDAWRDVLGALTEALALADQQHVTLAIEPETGNVINSARKARRLLDELKSPRLKIIMDAANLFHPGDLPRMKEILNEAFDLLGRDIVLAHAKELRHDGRTGDLPLGTGALDWSYYLSLLRRANFTGPIVMHGFDERAAPASIAFMQAALVTAQQAS